MSVALEKMSGDDNWDAIQRNLDIIQGNLRQPLPQVKVYAIAAITAIPNVSSAVLGPFDAEEYNVGSMHSNAVNNTRLTAKITGLYVVHGMFVANAVIPAGGRAFVSVVKNAAASVARSTSMTGGAGECQVTTQIRLAAGEWVELAVTNLSGAPMQGVNGINNTWFSMYRVGGYTNEGIA